MVRNSKQNVSELVIGSHELIQKFNKNCPPLGNPTDDGAPPVPNNFTKITSLVMTPHCHAPSCIRSGSRYFDRASNDEFSIEF